VPVTKRLRFEILRRDNHACRYCGAAAPDAKLTVDHVVPVALGGSDEPSNLVAACADCNGGKTSSSPDAPVVADVSDDAVRWASAMHQAAGRALADLNGRAANRRLFDERWSQWGSGSGESRQVLPRDPGWPATIDQLTAAGLPIEIIIECLDLAMGRTSKPGRKGVAHDQVFRYMCGIAWKKLTEIQKSASRIAGAGLADGEEETDRSAEQIEALRDMACEILGSFQHQIDHYLDDARAHLGADDPGIEEAAARCAAHDAARAMFALSDLLCALEDGPRWMAAAREQLIERNGYTFSEGQLLTRAAHIGVSILVEPKESADV
jgi:hypothetical protein